MGRNSLMGSLLVATLAAGAAACAGSVDADATGGLAVGEQGQLVARKKQWLQNYDANCDVCFKAFELCEVGADGDQATLDACQTALDSCVRGGLVNSDDGADQDGGAADGDTGNGNDDDNGNNNGDDDEADGSAEGDVDGGVSEEDGDDSSQDGDDSSQDGSDSDSDTDEATDEANRPNDGDGNGIPGDQVKGELVDAVKACLDDAKTCLDGAGSAQECVSDLKSCVRDALRGAFDDVCSGQRRQCIDRDVPEEVSRSVEDLCEGGFGGN